MCIRDRPITPTALNDLGSSQDIGPFPTQGSNSPNSSYVTAGHRPNSAHIELDAAELIDLGESEWPDMSHGSRRTKPTDAFNPSATSVQDQSVATETTRPPTTETLSDFATEAPSDLLRTPGAVSYTHLDVYKRQIFHQNPRTVWLRLSAMGRLHLGLSLIHI